MQTRRLFPRLPPGDVPPAAGAASIWRNDTSGSGGPLTPARDLDSLLLACNYFSTEEWIERVYMQPNLLSTEAVRLCMLFNFLHGANGEDDTAAEVKQAADNVIFTS